MTADLNGIVALSEDVQLFSAATGDRLALARKGETARILRTVNKEEIEVLFLEGEAQGFIIVIKA